MNGLNKCRNFSSIYTRRNICARRYPGIIRAFYSTGPEIPEWPKSTNPSPYEIFGLSRGKPDIKKLRKVYIQLAKKYHPDATSSIPEKTKNERFRKIMTAYEILQDENKRLKYEYSHENSRPIYTNYGKNPHFHTRPFYPDGRPEDWGFTSEAKQRMEDEQFQKNLAENRYKLVILIAIVVSLYGAGQVYRQMIKYRDASQVAELSTLQNRLEILRARANYAMGEKQEDRIQRFLRGRHSASYYDPYTDDHEKELLVSDQNRNLTLLDISSETDTSENH